MGIFLIRRLQRATPPRMFLLGLLACCSCSKNDKPLFPANGSVSFKGLPAAKAMVVFHSVGDPDPKAVKPRAIVAKDGSFQVYTYTAGDGLPAGEYIVTVVGEKPHAHAKQSNSASKKKRDETQSRSLPPHYENPKTSDLRVQIKEGPNELPPFELKAR